MLLYLLANSFRSTVFSTRFSLTSTRSLVPRFALQRCGFYVFTGVHTPEELADIEADFQDIRTRLPTHRGSLVDSKGRPAMAINCKAPTISWAKPLSDPNGGTQNANGRYAVKMFEPKPEEGAPDEVVVIFLGSLQFSETHLRVYGHPGLLKMAEAVNGKDFVPFNEAIWIKEPGRGASTSWHQDVSRRSAAQPTTETKLFDIVCDVSGRDPLELAGLGSGNARVQLHVAGMLARL